SAASAQGYGAPGRLEIDVRRWAFDVCCQRNLDHDHEREHEHEHDKEQLWPSREPRMKAVQLVEIGAPLEDAEIPLPEIGPSEVLVRVAACGICHSDAHYRAGISPIDPLPVTLGHEVAGRVETVGREVHHISLKSRVYVHYLVSCGCCDFCRRGHEQFCSKGQMIGKNRDGGYAEFIKVPGRNVFVLPDEIPFELGA